MTAITSSPTSMRRPNTVNAAIVILVLLAVSVLIPLPGMGDIPLVGLIIGFVFAALKLVAAVGLWRCRKWAAILGFVAVLLDALMGAPALIDPPSTAIAVYVVIAIVLSVVALVLLVLQPSRTAYI